MASAYDSLYTGQHNDGYEPRILGLEGISTTFTSQISALQASTTAISTTASAIRTTANSKVSKTGDTMTGNLYINNNGILLTDSGMALGTTASTNHYEAGILFRDNSTNNIGYFKPYSLTNGQQGVYIESVQNINGTNQYNTLRIGVNAAGVREITINDPAKPAWRKALGLPGKFKITYANGHAVTSTNLASCRGAQFDTDITLASLMPDGVAPGNADTTMIWFRHANGALLENYFATSDGLRLALYLANPYNYQITVSKIWMYIIGISSDGISQQI